MINVENGRVMLKGSESGIMTDLTLAIKYVKIAFMEAGHSEEKVDSLISDAVRLSNMSPEKLAEEAAKKLLEMLMS